MTPEQEAVYLYCEGRGLSDLWGDVSQENFRQFERVVNKFAQCSSDKELTRIRQRAIQKQYDDWRGE